MVGGVSGPGAPRRRNQCGLAESQKILEEAMGKGVVPEKSGPSGFPLHTVTTESLEFGTGPGPEQDSVNVCGLNGPWAQVIDQESRGSVW